jgi:hypothetical protein
MVDVDDSLDLEKLRLPERVVEKGLATAKARRRRAQFIKVPNSWVEALRDARWISTYRVALYLLHRQWKDGGGPIPLSNVALTWVGVSRWEKWRALAELEQAGLVKVERRPRRAPLITVLAQQS